MSKYSEELVEQIESYIEDDGYSIPEIREMVNTNRKTLCERRDTKPESGKAVKAMEGRFEGKLATTARRSLIRRLNGYRRKKRRKVLLLSLFSTKAPPTSPSGEAYKPALPICRLLTEKRS